MTVAVIILAVAWAATIIVLLHRDNRREAAHTLERATWAQERRELNQRIQAPELAAAEALPPVEPEEGAHPYFHDEYAEIIANRDRTTE